MSRISGFNDLGTFVEQGATNIAAAGGKTGVYAGTAANAAFLRFVKHASQTGGTTPIAWLSYNLAETAPSSTDSLPIYDGDSLWIWPEELRSTSVASSDANQPTLHYVLRFIR